jgi:signal transduction histidine kinase
MRILSINCGAHTLQVLQELTEAAKYELRNFPFPAKPAMKWDPEKYELLVLDAGPTADRWIPLLRSAKERNPRLTVILLSDPSEAEKMEFLDFRWDCCLQRKVPSRQLEGRVVQAIQYVELERQVEKASKEAARWHKELRESLDRQKEARVEKDLTYRELMVAYSRLQDVNQKKNNFLSRATHELRTPVTVIKGYHRILLDERLGKLQPEQKEVLRESEESCSRLIRIINSMVELSRMEAGKLELAYQENDFIGNIKQVASGLKEACKRKRLSLVLEVDKGIPCFQYDREKLNQVLTNILENSIKYTPEGGRILLSAKPCFWERRTSGNKVIPGSQRNQPSNGDTKKKGHFNSVRVEISDTGIGISPEHHQEIFEEFTQTSSNQVNRSGLGLGLAISKRIIDAHGGRIAVESQVNAGSKFVFMLPFVPLAASETSSVR